MKRVLQVSAAVIFAVSAANAADWSNSGGNASRNCRTTEIGPTDPLILWTGGRTSIIAWQPVTLGNRVYMVRQTHFIPNNVPNDALIVCQDLDTGTECWAVPLPYNPGDWTPWIAGARDGRVYASRSGNGGSVAAKMYALDAASGAIVWDSDDTTRAGAYDGVVFAPDGDLIVASHLFITRIESTDGSTVWNQPRDCSVSGECGGAVTFGDALYIDGVAPGGNVIERRDLATGLYMYETPIMPGTTEQNWPFVGPDGTVYLSRTQNNPAVDFFYAFEDTGAALVEKWHVPAGWTTVSEFGVADDGSVYMIDPGRILTRRSSVDGSVIDTGPVLDTDFPTNNLLKPRMAVDALGKLFVSNGQHTTGRLYAFDADLTPRWSIPVQGSNIGSPVIGAGGTLVVAGIGTNVRAYRTAVPCNPCDANCDAMVDAADVPPFVDALLGTPGGCSPCESDTNADALRDGRDVADFVGCLLNP